MACASASEGVNLECPICTERFINPKLLTCRHSFCESCIQTWIIRLSADSEDGTLQGIECPLCRAVSPPPMKHSKLDDWAKLLPNNFAILIALDTKHSVEADDVGDTVQPRKEDLCGPCASLDEFEKATFHCVVCKENMCKVCTDSHRKLKLTKSHEILDIEAAKEMRSCLNNYKGFLMCKVHPTKELEFYCKDDDSVFCATCAFLQHRACNKVVEIGKESRVSCQQGVNSHVLLRRLRTLEGVLDEIIDKRQNYERRLREDLDELPVRLKEQRKTLMRKFDKFENEAISKGQYMFEELFNENKGRIDQCTNLLELAQSCIATTVRLSQKGTLNEKFIITRAISGRLDEMRQALNVECSEYSFKGLLYEENKQTMVLLDLFKSYGAVQTKDKQIKLPELPIQKSLKECKLQLKSTGVRKTAPRKPIFISCSFCPDIRSFALADQNNKRLLMVNFHDEKVRELKTKSAPYAVRFINSTLIAVTFPQQQQICLYSSDESNGNGAYTQVKCLTTSGECYALDSDTIGSLYVTHFQDEDWWLSIIDIDSNKISGKIKDSDGRSFKSFWHMKLGHSLEIFQPCQVDNALYCFDSSCGSPIFQFKHKSLVCPGGVDLDIEGNVYMCGIMSKNVYQLTGDGRLVKIIKTPGCDSPVTLALSMSGEDAVVLGNARDSDARHYKFVP